MWIVAGLTGARDPASSTAVDSIAVLVVGPVLALLAGIGCDLAGLQSQAAAQLPALVAAIPAVIAVIRLRRRRDPARELPALGQGTFARPGMLIAGIFGFGVLLMDTLVGAVLGFATSMSLQQVGGNAASFEAAFGTNSLILGVPLELVLTGVLAARAAHYIGQAKLRWLLVGLALFAVVRMIILLVAAGGRYGLNVPVIQLLGGVLLLLPLFAVAAWAGVVWSRRTHAAFSAAAFLRRLPPAEQPAALARLAGIAPEASWAPSWPAPTGPAAGMVPGAPPQHGPAGGGWAGQPPAAGPQHPAPWPAPQSPGPAPPGPPHNQWSPTGQWPPQQ